jgi:hypothetical protein
LSAFFFSSPPSGGSLVSRDWPSFAIGPDDSIFALGVISLKFMELETIFQFLFGAILRLDRDQTKVISAKLGTTAALELLSRDRVAETTWSEDVKDHVLHFLSAMKICADNRNHLMHSGMAWRFGDKRVVMYKRSRPGSLLALSTTLAELRQVADEMNFYCVYGRKLDNAISNPATAFPLPKKKPDLPVKLEYSGA